jgi:uncharacterized protein YacL
MPSKKLALTTLVAIALAYFLLDALNRVLFSPSVFENGGGWIYLPSGLRLAFLLIFLDLGALGIILASCAIGWVHYSAVDAITVLGAGFLSGVSPWVARIICREKFKLDKHLQQLTPTALVKMAVTFAALNAVMQQLWWTWRDPSTQFIEATAGMFVGDLLGTVALLYLAKFSFSLLPLPKRIK